MCSNTRKHLVLVHNWDERSEKFERVHIDYAGPFQGHHFFIVLDTKSKRLEDLLFPRIHRQQNQQFNTFKTYSQFTVYQESRPLTTQLTSKVKHLQNFVQIRT